MVFHTSFKAMSREPPRNKCLQPAHEPFSKRGMCSDPCRQTFRCLGGYSTQIRILIQPVLFQRSNPEMISILPYSWHDWLSILQCFLKKAMNFGFKSPPNFHQLDPLKSSFQASSKTPGALTLLELAPSPRKPSTPSEETAGPTSETPPLRMMMTAFTVTQAATWKFSQTVSQAAKKKWRLCHVLSKLECLIRFFSSLHLDWTTFPASECQFQDLLKLKGQAIKPSQISPVFLSSKNHPMIQGSFTNSLQWW